MLISFEGLDGSGKSTQINLLKSHLDSKCIKCEVFREPGGDLFAEKIRELLLDDTKEHVFPETELLLYIASRAQIVRSRIAPAIEKGITVILDRYVDSTMAYQGYGRELGHQVIDLLNSYATCEKKYYPDITFFIDVEPGKAYSRVISRNEKLNRMEKAGKEFFRKTREGFMNILEKEPHRFCLIDGSLTPDLVFKSILFEMKKRNIL